MSMRKVHQIILFLFVPVICCLIFMICVDASSIPFEAQYTITSPGLYGGNEYGQMDESVRSYEFPHIKVIKSKVELNEFYNTHKRYYDFSSTQGTVTFEDAIKKYDGSFFNTSCLVIVMVYENSGSYLNKVTHISEDGTITIQTLVPLRPVTSDMGLWSLLVEVDKQYADLNFSVEQTERRSTRYYDKYKEKAIRLNQF